MAGTTPTAASGSGHPIALPRIALMGVHGFGAHHLINLDRLSAAGALKLVAVADPNPPGRTVGRGRPGFPGSSRTALLRGGTGCGHHRHPHSNPRNPGSGGPGGRRRRLPGKADGRLNGRNLKSFAWPQRPPAGIRPNRLPITRLTGPARTGDSHHRRRAWHHPSISAKGMWVRDKAYYQRSRWAGKRTINGVDVVDGVTTNPLAHAVATALLIAGIRSSRRH